MQIQRAFKTKLRVNNKERGIFNRCAGTSRYVYNWALADRIERYEAGNPTNYYDQKKRFNAIKDEICPWIREVPSRVSESAFRDLDAAYKNFFRRVKQGAEKKGFPKFKSKRNSRKSFTIRGVVVERDRVRLPRIGWIRLAEVGYIPEGQYKTNACTISEDGEDWYISIQMEVEAPGRQGHEGVIGVDLGVKERAVCSDGTFFENGKLLAKYEKKMARLQRELSRRQKGGENWKKTKAKIRKLHAKIRHARRHAQHNVSRHVTANALPEVVVIEDLNVAGMVKNHSLAKAVSDAGMGELARQIEYKAEWNGVQVVKADRWFPSSKTCSHCGCVNSGLTLNDRTFRCPDCGFEIDRDLNAAINLAALGEPVINGGLPVELSPVGGTVKQEVGSGNA